MKNCTTCGNEIAFGSKCTNCYEVESRLEKYIQSKKGRRFVAETLIGR